MKTKKQIRSKYLGMKFVNSDGEIWTVMSAKKTSYNNFRFVLSRPAKNNAVKSVSITSKTMKKLATSYLTIEDVLRHKDNLKKKNVYAYRNSVWYSWETVLSYK